MPLAKIADTLFGQRTIAAAEPGLRAVDTTCLCFALDSEEQKLSRFHYQYAVISG